MAYITHNLLSGAYDLITRDLLGSVGLAVLTRPDNTKVHEECLRIMFLVSNNISVCLRCAVTNSNNITNLYDKFLNESPLTGAKVLR
jgi:hypothetical protein